MRIVLYIWAPDRGWVPAAVGLSGTLEEWRAAYRARGYCTLAVKADAA